MSRTIKASHALAIVLSTGCVDVKRKPLLQKNIIAAVGSGFM